MEPQPSQPGAQSRPVGNRLSRVAAYFAALVVTGICAFAACAWQPIIPEGPTPNINDYPAAVIEQGTRLASAGFCVSCHTIAGGKPFAGGYAMKTDFGTIYSTNISPDRETGIGAWTEAAFKRALREGVARDGSHLFPAFPYDHFTKLSDDDIHALYAFLMTRQPVHQTDRPNEMTFPFGFRPLQAGWKLLFFHPQRFTPQHEKSEAWNRGAYLAESLSHCSSCHTPRGVLGQELRARLYHGTAVDGWYAPALTRDNASPAPWTSDELYGYLASGTSKYHGTAAGPMASVSQGLAFLTQEDQRALVTYIESIGFGDSRADQIDAVVGTALAADALDSGKRNDAGARLFVSACASCHYNRAPDVNVSRPELGLNSAVHLDDPTNLIHVILNGVNANDGAPGVVMPGFARGLKDEDVALIAAYLRSTRTDKAAWPNLQQRVAQIRAEESGEKK